MPSPTAATDFSQQLADLITATLLSVRGSWAQVPARNIMGGWASISTQVLAQLASAQIAAARMGDAYVPQVLEELGIGAESVASVVPQALVVGSSGLPLSSVLGSVPLRALHTSSVAGVDAGLDSGGALLDGIVMTQVADAGRLGASLRTVASPRVGGYVREVSADACGRCLVLAGRWYRWSSGFLRHPRCQCVNVPVGQAQGKGMVTDAAEAFQNMSRAQQDKAFTVSGAKAIRDGGDISRVVNATGRRSGMTTTASSVKLTYEGTRATGGRLRLTPEAIYRFATDRQDAIGLLKAQGYLF